MLVALFWRRHRDLRPSWGRVRARIILGQQDRVRLGRNLDWGDLLFLTLSPIPSGKKFQLREVPTDLQAAKKRRKRKLAIYDEPLQAVDDQEPPSEPCEDEDIDQASDLSEDEVYFERPAPKKRRREDDARIEATYQRLLKAAEAESDSSIKKWVSQHYPMYAKSITYTGKHHTLQVLATLIL